ncbi:hypothetical protein M569_09233 [Genlisea aurea]|uniref:Uncharacterized protein n=1 Tax=Genlisea aurea TaxID=192259 RepID=S8CLA4_9LAMI|nr:hypothetical protein M569_09233 [Genlisea aurea]
MNSMKASIKFREAQKPLVRAKIPLNILSLPFQSGICAGDSKEVSISISTRFDFGPSLRFSFRPNDSANPFSFVFSTGIGNFGSPADSPLTMGVEFSPTADRNPAFFIRFRPELGNFSIKKSHSSDLVGNSAKEKAKDAAEYSVDRNGFFLPATLYSGAASEIPVEDIFKGTELNARTAVPVLDFAVVNFRWGLRVPLQRCAADDFDAVVIQNKSNLRLPALVMNKIGIENAVRSKKNEEKAESGAGAERDEVIEACLDVKKRVERIEAENGLLSKALRDLRSEMASGKMNFTADNHRNKLRTSKKPPEAGDGSNSEVTITSRVGSGRL